MKAHSRFSLPTRIDYRIAVLSAFTVLTWAGVFVAWAALVGVL